MCDIYVFSISAKAAGDCDCECPSTEFDPEKQNDLKPPDDL